MTPDTQHRLVAALGVRGSAIPASGLAVTVLPGSPGLYSWWANEEAARLFGEVLGAEVTQPIYIGQAGAGRSGATLASRILKNHLGPRRRRSTLRRTIAAVLDASSATTDNRPVSEAEISTWMRDHLSVVVVPLDDRALVAAAEDAALRVYDPPLNLKAMMMTESRRRLRQLRTGRATFTAAEAALDDHPTARVARPD